MSLRRQTSWMETFRNITHIFLTQVKSSIHFLQFQVLWIDFLNYSSITHSMTCNDSVFPVRHCTYSSEKFVKNTLNCQNTIFLDILWTAWRRSFETLMWSSVGVKNFMAMAFQRLVTILPRLMWVWSTKNLGIILPNFLFSCLQIH